LFQGFKDVSTHANQLTSYSTSIQSATDHMFISVALEKAFDKTQHSFMTKVLKTV
jgi:hypothetical protein